MSDRPSSLPTPPEPRSEFGDLCVVIRRGLLLVTAYIEKRYGTDEPVAMRHPRKDERRDRAA